MPDLKQLTLEEAKQQLNMKRSMLEMLKDNTRLGDLANLRELWIEPLERLIKELERAESQKALR
jgi:hypothetical protein